MNFCNNESCVDVEFIEVQGGTATAIVVADTKNPDQEPLQFTEEEWTKFVADVKEGKYDL